LPVAVDLDGDGDQALAANTSSMLDVQVEIVVEDV
jgi:hypothetical protein